MMGFTMDVLPQIIGGIMVIIVVIFISLDSFQKLKEFDINKEIYGKSISNEEVLFAYMKG